MYVCVFLCSKIHAPDFFTWKTSELPFEWEKSWSWIGSHPLNLVFYFHLRILSFIKSFYALNCKSVFEHEACCCCSCCCCGGGGAGPCRTLCVHKEVRGLSQSKDPSRPAVCGCRRLSRSQMHTRQILPVARLLFLYFGTGKMWGKMNQPKQDKNYITI